MSQKNGGVYYVSTGSTISVTGASYYNITAEEGGIFYITTDSDLLYSFIGCSFELIQVTKSGIGSDNSACATTDKKKVIRGSDFSMITATDAYGLLYVSARLCTLSLKNLNIDSVVIQG